MFKNSSRIRSALVSAGPWIALLVLVLVCGATNENFLHTRNLLNVVRQCSYSGLIALGMTFVIVAGGIDLSVGSLFAFCGVGAALLTAQIPAGAMGEGMLALVTALLCLGLGAVGGAVNGGLVVAGKLPPFIATLGTYSIFRSVALYSADSGTVSVSGGAVHAFCAASFLGLSTPVWFLLALTVVLGVALAYTPWGRHTLATGANERVALFAGIRTGRIRFLTYLLTGLLAGGAAFLSLGRLGSISSSNAGSLYELDAIAAVVIGGASMAGGRGRVAGTLAGVLVLGVVSNALDLWGINVSLQGCVKGLVILLSVLIQRKK